MASNATQYKDLTPAAKLDKATLNKMVWLSCQLRLHSTMKECRLAEGYGQCYQVFRRSIQTKKI